MGITFDDILDYKEVKERARRIAKSKGDVLIIGESGVGKRLFAEAIHNESERKGKPFIVWKIGGSGNERIFTFPY